MRPGRGRGGKGKDAAAAPPPGPPRSRSCSGPPAAPPGPARQAPPARRRRGWGVDAVAYAFARERVQEGPCGRHLAIVPRGAWGSAKAGHGAGGALGAAEVSVRFPPASQAPYSARPEPLPHPSSAPHLWQPIHVARACGRQTHEDTQFRCVCTGLTPPPPSPGSIDLLTPPAAGHPLPWANPLEILGRGPGGGSALAANQEFSRLSCWTLPQSNPLSLNRPRRIGTTQTPPQGTQVKGQGRPPGGARGSWNNSGGARPGYPLTQGSVHVVRFQCTHSGHGALGAGAEREL